MIAVQVYCKYSGSEECKGGQRFCLTCKHQFCEGHFGADASLCLDCIKGAHIPLSQKSDQGKRRKTTNTKARHEEILAAAAEVLEKVGGVEAVDALPQDERVPQLRKMAKMVQKLANCTSPPARSNVAKAMQRARFGIMQQTDPDRWGGSRQDAGRPPLPEAQKSQRQQVSTKLAPGSKELAQAIAQIKELSGWGHALEVAMVKMVENDQELKIKLAEMGIIAKGNNGEGLSNERFYAQVEREFKVKLKGPPDLSEEQFYAQVKEVMGFCPDEAKIILKEAGFNSYNPAEDVAMWTILEKAKQGE